MFIVFEIIENENPSDILNQVIRTPKGIFETEELARKWIFNNFEMYTHVFQDGREYIKHNADKTVIHIKYEGGCQPDPDFEATYVIRPYEINTVFDEINYFDNKFFENISNELSEVKF
jgi:hypothetical protein